MVSDPNAPVTIEQALDQFMLQLEANGRSQHTILQYRRHILALARWLVTSGDGSALAALSPEVVARFMISGAARNRPDGKPKKATAVNALRSSVRCFCAYLHAAGFVSMNPGRLLKRALCSSRRSRALSQDEVDRFLAVLAEGTDAQARRDRVLFTLMLGTGLRIGSALGLDVEDVDVERGELLLRGAKGNRVERVFLPDHLLPVVADHLASTLSGAVFRNGGGRRLTVRHANRLLAGYFARAGVRRVAGTHVLRHTFGTRLYRRTGDVLLVKDALCHRGVASTLAYTTSDDGWLRAAISPRE